MTLAGIRKGDTLRCDVRGRQFDAVALETPRSGSVRVEPITQGITYRLVKARQVVRVTSRASNEAV